MATRSIITHQPEIACDICGRRLLRGERPDVFLVAGEQRTVCELCVPRAAGEGWTRASEAPATATVRAPRTRRGRSLLDRLRQRREAESGERPRRAGAWDREHGDGWEASQRDAWEPERAGAWEPEQPGAREMAYAGGPTPAAKRRLSAGLEIQDGEAFAVDSGIALSDPSAPVSQDAATEAPVSQNAATQPFASRDAAAEATTGGTLAEQAIEIFNASQCASRVAGIARALGEPSVTVRAGRQGAARVTVVVAWELCWYRYEVDLGEHPATIALLAEGTELDQLELADRAGNAAADERGELSLVR